MEWNGTKENPLRSTNSCYWHTIYTLFCTFFQTVRRQWETVLLLGPKKPPVVSVVHLFLRPIFVFRKYQTKFFPQTSFNLAAVFNRAQRPGSVRKTFNKSVPRQFCSLPAFRLPGKMPRHYAGRHGDCALFGKLPSFSRRPEKVWSYPNIQG